MDIEELNKNIVDLENPVLIATELGFFISDGCTEGSLSLYEAFLLTDTELQLLQKGAIQPAWNYSLGMSHLLRLERLFVLATYFKETRHSEIILGRISDAMPILTEKREHFSKEVANQLFDGNISEAINLLSLNTSKSRLFDEGPYIDEVFPYEIIDAEKKVLAGSFENHKEVSDAITNLLAKIMIKHD